MTRALRAVLLGVMYIVLVGAASPMDCAIAFLIGLAAGTRLPRADVEQSSLSYVVGLPKLFVGTSRELLHGAASMLLVLAGVRPWRRNGTVEVPFGDRTSQGAAVSALIACATPGSVLLESNEAARVMTFSVVDAADPESLRNGLDGFYARYQRPVFP